MASTRTNCINSRGSLSSYTFLCCFSQAGSRRPSLSHSSSCEGTDWFFVRLVVIRRIQIRRLGKAVSFCLYQILTCCMYCPSSPIGAPNCCGFAYWAIWRGYNVILMNFSYWAIWRGDYFILMNFWYWLKASWLIRLSTHYPCPWKRGKLHGLYKWAEYR